MKTYHYHTHYRILPGDLHTPVSTYLKVRDVFPQSALMESSDYHSTENNRSFIALCPLASVAIGQFLPRRRIQVVLRAVWIYFLQRGAIF